MKYAYDVFISYKRYGEWTTWVLDIFKPLFEQHLSMELGLGNGAQVFSDDKIEAGADWPPDLRNGVANSRVLVPVFSKMYFGSSWCLRELYAARYKEAQLGFRTSLEPKGIIVPIRIHDGLKCDLPEHLHECSDIHATDFTKFALTSLSRSSPLYLEFEIAIKAWVKGSVMPAIKRSTEKPFNPDWMKAISAEEYEWPQPADYSMPDLPSLG